MIKSYNSLHKCWCIPVVPVVQLSLLNNKVFGTFLEISPSCLFWIFARLQDTIRHFITPVIFRRTYILTTTSLLCHDHQLRVFVRMRTCYTIGQDPRERECRMTPTVPNLQYKALLWYQWRVKHWITSRQFRCYQISGDLVTRGTRPIYTGTTSQREPSDLWYGIHGGSKSTLWY